MSCEQSEDFQRIDKHNACHPSKCALPMLPTACPYDLEVNDKVKVCDCCSKCRHECERDI